MGEMKRRTAAVAPHLAIGEKLVENWVFGAQWIDAGMYPGAGEGVLALTDLCLIHVDDRTGHVIRLSRWDVDRVHVHKVSYPLMRVAHVWEGDNTWSFYVSRSTAKTVENWFRDRPARPPAVLPASDSTAVQARSTSVASSSSQLRTQCFLEGVTPAHPRGLGQISVTSEGLKFQLDATTVSLRWQDLEHFRDARDLDGLPALMVRSKVGTGSYIALISDPDLDQWRVCLRNKGVAETL